MLCQLQRRAIKKNYTKEQTCDRVVYYFDISLDKYLNHKVTHERRRDLQVVHGEFRHT